MIKLLLLAFLLSNCADKSNNTTESTDTTEVLEPLIASYDKGLELTKVFSDFGSWYYYQFSDNPTKFKPKLYKGVYWDQSNNQYYITYIYETNNIEYTIDTNRMYEPVYFSNNLRLQDKRLEGKIDNYVIINELLYVGSISPTERVYIDTLHTNLFIKILKPTLYRYISNGVTNITNSRRETIYPVLPLDFGEFSFHIEYTNSKYTNSKGNKPIEIPKEYSCDDNSCTYTFYD